MTTTIEQSIEVGVPASIAYNTWTQFELFPHFMDGVQEVQQKDSTHLYWRADIFGKTEEWTAEITEQIPDKRIAWHSQDGAQNAGVVTFHRISDDASRVMVQMEYEPERLTEKLGDAFGLLKRRVHADLERFKEFVEREGSHIRGWRGDVPGPDAAGAGVKPGS